MREKYLAGELSYPEMKGMESRDAYRAIHRAQQAKIKDEPVHHLTEDVNAMPPPKGKKVICYDCGQEGHFRRNCPRTTSGLSTAGINRVEDDLEDDDEQEVNALYRQRGHPADKSRHPNEKRGYQQKRNVTFRQPYKRPGRIVAQLVENEEGQLDVIQVDSETEEAPQAQNDTDEAVHFLA